MSNKIVGIRFIANKELMEDTVANTGATWVKNQVNNFSENLAKLLLVHPDVFELADIDPDAETYIGKRTVNGGIEPVAFINLNAMDAKQLAAYAKMEFNRVVDTEQAIEVIRSEVHAYMTNNNLDLEATEKSRITSGGMILEKEVTAEEYQMVLAGVLELKLVAVTELVANTVIEPETNNVIVDDANNDDIKPSDIELGKKVDNPELTLPELVASLDKNGLRALARQEKVTYANSMNEEQLRAKLLRDLMPKG